MVLDYAILSQTRTLPEGATLLLPGQQAWLDFFRVMGFNSISNALKSATVLPELRGLITSLALYHVVGSPDFNITSSKAVTLTRPTALEDHTVGLVFPNGTDYPVQAATGQVGTSAKVVEEGEVCGLPALLLDSVLLPAQTVDIPKTIPANVVAALELLAEEVEANSPPPPTVVHSPPPPAPSPPPADGCPFDGWAAAQAQYPNLSVLAGLLKLTGLTLDVFGSPANASTIMLPTSSAMLNFIHGLNITGRNADLLFQKIPAIASYLFVPQALNLTELHAAQQVQSLLTTLSGGNYPLTFRVSTNAVAVPNQVRGNLNTANILKVQTVCNSRIIQLDKTILPSVLLDTMPNVTFPAHS